LHMIQINIRKENIISGKKILGYLYFN